MFHLFHIFNFSSKISWFFLTHYFPLYLYTFEYTYKGCPHIDFYLEITLVRLKHLLWKQGWFWTHKNLLASSYFENFGAGKMAYG